ncbi:MAG: PilN domain-containing protein [bacterium]|nr:PilN domain-containing protein [bacterium]
MKNKPRPISINLIPKDPFFESALGRTMRWALSVGRYIVIFTELVVIISFATRFSLDRQLTDLNDDINQKETIIQSYGDLEEEVRTAQGKINQYQQIEQQTNLIDVFPALSSITPRDVLLSDLTIRPGTVSLSGSTLSNNSLNLLINNIQLSPYFTKVSVDKIENAPDQSPGFLFVIRAETNFAPDSPSKTSSTTGPTL